MPGAKIVLNSEYFHIAQPGEKSDGRFSMTKNQARNFVNYVGTREGVSINFNPLDLTEEEANRKATVKQMQTIDGLLREVPSAKDTFEFEDYRNKPTVGNASELIARAAEMGYGRIETEKVIGADEAKNYVEYVAKRPGAVREGAHGLFSSVPDLDLNKIADEVAAYQGRIWRNVISIRREDADRLGYNTQKPWKQAVQQQLDTIAASFHIPPEHLRWYAGMHNTGHHPHIHLFVYSTDPKEGKLTQTGIRNLKRGFSEIIFADERLHIYQQKDEAREKLKSRADEILSSLEHSNQFRPEQTEAIYQDLLKLGAAVQSYSGRHFYKYLPKDLKILVDKLMDQLSSAPDLQKLYGLYCEQQENLDRMYVNDSHSVPMTENREFYMLKNKIVQYAEKLSVAVIGIDQIGRASGFEEYETPKRGPRPEDPPPPPMDDEDFSSLSDRVPAEQDVTPPAKFEEVPLEKPFDDRPRVKTSAQPHLDFLELMEKAANPSLDPKHYAQHQYDLARKYFDGEGVERDYEKARMWFGLAAENGHTLAKYQLGKMYLYGIGIEKDPNLGKEFCLEAYCDITSELQEETGAELRQDGVYPTTLQNVGKYYAYLEYLVGRMESAGEGVKQNDQKAFIWFQAAALHGHVHSEYTLAQMYCDGRGTVQDYEEAFRLYAEASDSKDRYAAYAAGRMIHRGIGIPKDEKAAASYYARASKKDVPYADYALAQMCESGEGIKKDEEAAKTLYKKALDEFLEQEKHQPDPLAEFQIATMYLRGKGVKADPASAAEWLEKAVKSGSPRAAYELAKMYAGGGGVKKDKSKAQGLYQKALQGFLTSERDNPNAGQEYRIANMYLQGKGVKADPASAAVWLEKASENQHPMAMYQLAAMYGSGIGVPENKNKAAELSRKALAAFLREEKDSPDAGREYRIANMHEQGIGAEENVQGAIKWYRTAADAGNGYAQYRLSRIFQTGQPLLANQYFQKALQTFQKEDAEAPDADREYRIAQMLSQLPEKYPAVQWYEKSAHRGNPRAAYDLAKLLEQNPAGDSGIAQKYYADALKGFIRKMFDEEGSAETRGTLALRIGMMCLYGQGCIANEQKAFEWILKSAELGNPIGQYQAGKMLLNGTGCLQDPFQAFYWFSCSARNGNSYAQYQVGKMFETGTGTVKSKAAAKEWFRAAAENGNEAAQKHLNYLENQKKYQAAAIIGVILRLFGSNIIEDSTTRRFGIDRKTRLQKRRMKQTEDDLDEVM